MGGINRNSDDAIERFQHAVERHFIFSAYLSLNVEWSICDSIQIHRHTWLCLILSFVIFALMHRYAHISLVAITPFFIGVAVAALAIMWLVSKRRQHTIMRRSSTGTPGSNSAS